MPAINAVCVLNTTTNKYEWRLKSDNTVITDADVLAGLNAAACKDCSPECWYSDTVTIKMDNQSTGEWPPAYFPSPKFVHDYRMVLSNGKTCEFTVDAFGGGQAAIDSQLDIFVTELSACFGKPVVQPPKATPDGDLSTVQGRFVQVTCCATDPIPVSWEARRAGTTSWIPLLFETVLETVEHQKCTSCGSEPKWYLDGVEVPEPDCVRPCAAPAPVLPAPDEPACALAVLPGPWCDVVYGAGPDDDDETVQQDILITVATCGTKQELIYQLVDSEDELSVYTPVGSIVNCETGVPPVVPPPVCPEGLVWKDGQYEKQYFILDNSNWTGAPTPHITNGFNFEITFIRADGSTDVWQQSADPLFSNFLSTAPGILGCKVLNICANHTSPKGCKAFQVANLAMYPAYDPPTYPADPQNNLSNPDQSEAWASAWLLDCGDCKSPIVRVEITDASDPAYVEAYKEPIVHTEIVKIQYAVDCDDVYWKDCNGNDITAPTSLCCVKPCPAEIVIPDELIDECNADGNPIIENADYTGAIQITRGRPSNTSEWILWDNRQQPPTELIKGATFEEFVANAAALGYTDFTSGPTLELHYLCPCPPPTEGEPFAAGQYFVTADGTTITKPACTPLTELPNAPAKVLAEALKSLRVKVCGPVDVNVLPVDPKICSSDACVTETFGPTVAEVYHDLGRWGDLSSLVNGLAFPVVMDFTGVTADTPTAAMQYRFDLTSIPECATIKSVKAQINYQGVADSDPGDNAEVTAALVLFDGTGTTGLTGWTSDTANSYWGDYVPDYPYDPAWNATPPGNVWAGGLFGTLDTPGSGSPGRIITLCATGKDDGNGGTEPITASDLGDLILPFWQQRYAIHGILHSVSLSVVYSEENCDSTYDSEIKISDCSLNELMAITQAANAPLLSEMRSMNTSLAALVANQCGQLVTIWAEQNGALVGDRWNFSWGNGNEHTGAGINDWGYIAHYPWELVSLTVGMRLSNTADTEIEMTVNGLPVGQSIVVPGTATKAVDNTVTHLGFPGDSINFRTLSVGGGNDVVVSALIKYTI